MEALQELWLQVQPVLTGSAALVIIVALLAVGLIKKLVKLAVTAGALFLLWIVLQQLGVQLPV